MIPIYKSVSDTKHSDSVVTEHLKRIAPLCTVMRKKTYNIEWNTVRSKNWRSRGRENLMKNRPVAVYYTIYV